MKILHIGYTNIGGAGIGMMNLHQAMLDRGIDSKVLVVQKQTTCNTVFTALPNLHVWANNRFALLLEKVARRMGIYFNALDRIRMQMYKAKHKHPIPFSSPITNYDLSEHPLVKEADIINLHFISDFVDIETFFSKVHKPIVWIMRDENPGLGGFHYTSTKEEYYKDFATLEDMFINIKRKAIKGCNNLYIVSLSDYMRRFCQNVDFISDLPNTVIGNVINPDEYPIFSQAEARETLHLNKTDIIISFVCFDLGEKRKRLKEVIEALTIIKQSPMLGERERQHIQLVCVGMNKIQLSHPNVICLGKISDKRQLSMVYAASNVFVTPSDQESFGKTVIEALYCGTPVVSTPTGIAPEVINEDNGCICPNSSPVEIASAIIRVLIHEAYNPEQIRQKATELFSPKAIVSQYTQLYKTILNK